MKIAHASIPADDPKTVAHVLADMLQGEALPFPPAGPSAWMAWSGDGALELEVTPRGNVITFEEHAITVGVQPLTGSVGKHRHGLAGMTFGLAVSIPGQGAMAQLIELARQFTIAGRRPHGYGLGRAQEKAHDQSGKNKSTHDRTLHQISCSGLDPAQGTFRLPL